MKQDNLLVILSDEHQSRALSCLGHFVQTPNLDRLAAQGTRFSNAYTPSPICVPARASFATGHYPHRTRCWDNALAYHGQHPSWGHALQQAGIAVESIGKLHYRDTNDDNGFDVEHSPMNIVGGKGMVWGSIRDEALRRSPKTRMLGEYIGAGTSTYTDYDQAMTARAVRWLGERGAKPEGPFCLYVGLVAPHFPLVVPQEFLDLYEGGVVPEPKPVPEGGNHPWVDKQNDLMNSEANFKDADERRTALAAYYALITWMDHNVGQLLDALDAAGLAETTTVIYSSDHGDNAGARCLWGKSNMYWESVEIPMIARGRRFAAGATCSTPVNLIDISAEIVDHFGLELLNSDMGPSPATPLSHIAAAPDDPTRVVFSEYHAAGSVSAALMVADARWKYINYHGFEPQLFDLAADPEELVNLAGTEAGKEAEARMHAQLLKICDPEAVNDAAFADQAAMLESYGGVEASRLVGAPGATPPPKVG